MDLSKVADWLRLSTRQLFWLVLFSSAVLSLVSFAPDAVIVSLGLLDIRTEYRTIIGLLWTFSVAGLAVAASGRAWKEISNRLTLRRWQRTLHELTPAEQPIIRQYVEGNTKTQYFEINEGVVESLVGGMILFRPSNVSRVRATFAYNIQPWAWEYLQKKPHIIETPKQ